jgi:hypothetical protein
MNSDFSTYFTRDRIIRLLCKYRLKAAKKKHTVQLIRDISCSEKSLKDLKKSNNNCPQELAELLPPRRQWIRPNKKDRNSNTFQDSQKLYEYSIIRKIRSTQNKVNEKKISPPQWLTNLNQFIAKIENRSKNPDGYEIEQPIIKPIKKENKKSCTECRPISLYNLEDRVLISLTAKYLTELFDEQFLDCSYAFRAVKKGAKARSHHDTILKIADHLKKSEGNELYVAECDIMKFFDCINHEMTSDLLVKLAQENKIEIEKSAIIIFKQYLSSYSFSKDVFPKNTTDYFDNCFIPGGHFAWKKDLLKKRYYENIETGENLELANIGVPQGGAISCFISNLVMHEVDRVITNTFDSDLLYLRFCDDMVILHSSREKCNQYLEKYKLALEDLKLLVHEPKVIESYDSEFWSNDSKSKAPYKWGNNNVDEANVPWLSFVGYQIRYDGAIRLRRKSMTKELEKQQEECRKVARSILVKDFDGRQIDINQTSKKSKRQQLFALENRLISMSVGRILLYKLNANQTLCWTNGFKELKNNSVLRRQLRMLDSNRNRQLYILKKKLNLLKKTTNSGDEEIEGRKILFGAPYSYFGFLNKSARRIQI